MSATLDVSTLVQLADLLDGTAEKWWGLDAMTKGRLLAAVRLRLLAQRHCDHARVSSDGECCYCSAPLADEHVRCQAPQALPPTTERD